MEAKKRKKGRRRAGKRFRRIWTAVLICAALAAVLAVVLILRPKSYAPKVERETEPTAVETLSPPTEIETMAQTKPETEPEPEMLPSMKKLYEQNSDIAGWLKIEGTAIDYPVMYTPEDEEFYKEHPLIQYTTLYKEETYEIVSVFRSQVFRQDENVFKYYFFIMRRQRRNSTNTWKTARHWNVMIPVSRQNMATYS